MSASARDRLKQIKGHLDGRLPTPMETMAAERQSTSFPTRELTHFLDGSRSRTELKESILREIERDPTFHMADIYDLTKEQWRERTMEKFKGFVHHLSNEPMEVFRLRMELVSLVDPGFWTRIGVHVCYRPCSGLWILMLSLGCSLARSEVRLRRSSSCIGVNVGP
eukprot:Partr_v1_DN28236_c0_g1_i5_m76008 putative Acyl-coenzyme A oxidase I